MANEVFSKRLVLVVPTPPPLQLSNLLTFPYLGRTNRHSQRLISQFSTRPVFVYRLFSPYLAHL